MSKITDIIVFGSPSDRSYLTKKFQKSCTDEELKELYDTLYGWTTTAWYTEEYKRKLYKGMENIKSIQKERKQWQNEELELR